MPTVTIRLDGTTDDKITALCAMVIQQQGHIAVLTHLTATMCSSTLQYSPEQAGMLLDQLVPPAIERANDDFRKFVLDHQINVIRQEPELVLGWFTRTRSLAARVWAKLRAWT